MVAVFCASYGVACFNVSHRGFGKDINNLCYILLGDGTSAVCQPLNGQKSDQGDILQSSPNGFVFTVTTIIYI